ncbi:hypothetical protein AVEN_218340-1 [Araneus ventricosus]|uniref:Uncharacterized protein n=1 Tax=Araneus ventricosus TaxID=182803 RepID=A0A4Y2AKF6_ARAVE|nr:hypothetical protein AVEN_218340-1 [Araneus ventricosus]
MTCCRRGEQLFAWQTENPGTTIDVMNEKSGFIRSGNSLPLIHGPVSMFTGPLSAAFPITRKSRCKNDYLPSPAAVKCHSHLTTCPPCHPDEFIEKCGDGHNVLARQCIPTMLGSSNIRLLCKN